MSFATLSFTKLSCTKSLGANLSRAKLSCIAKYCQESTYPLSICVLQIYQVPNYHMPSCFVHVPKYCQVPNCLVLPMSSGANLTRDKLSVPKYCQVPTYHMSICRVPTYCQVSSYHRRDVKYILPSRNAPSSSRAREMPTYANAIDTNEGWYACIYVQR